MLCFRESNQVYCTHPDLLCLDRIISYYIISKLSSTKEPHLLHQDILKARMLHGFCDMWQFQRNEPITTHYSRTTRQRMMAMSSTRLLFQLTVTNPNVLVTCGSLTCKHLTLLLPRQYLSGFKRLHNVLKIDFARTNNAKQVLSKKAVKVDLKVLDILLQSFPKQPCDANGICKEVPKLTKKQCKALIRVYSHFRTFISKNTLALIECYAGTFELTS